MKKMKKGITISRKTELILSLIAAAVCISVPFLGASQYILRTLTLIGIYGIMSLSLNITVGYAGQVNMGHAAFVAVGGYAYAIVTSHLSEWNFWVALLFAGVMTALAGLIVGVPTLRLNDVYFVIATTGFSEVVKVITLNWIDVTNGSLGIKNIMKPSVFGLELTNKNGGMYFLTLILLAVTLYVCWAIKNSKLGRSLFALKDDELAAQLMGIRTGRQKIYAFVLSSFLAGIAGVMYVSLNTYVGPDTFTADISTVILCIVIFGGLGSLKGMLIGSLLLIAFPEILRFLNLYKYIIYGLILVVLMRFKPSGLFGSRSRRRYKLPKGVIIKEGAQTDETA